MSRIHVIVLSFQGGIAFITIKGVLKIFYKQQQYKRQANRVVNDYPQDLLATTPSPVQWKKSHSDARLASIISPVQSGQIIKWHLGHYLWCNTSVNSPLATDQTWKYSYPGFCIQLYCLLNLGRIYRKWKTLYQKVMRKSYYDLYLGGVFYDSVIFF